MSLTDKLTGLYTDMYQLTMGQAYYFHGRKDLKANFDYFFRKPPLDSGYVVFAGLADVLEMLENYHFSEEDIAYLKEEGFHQDFLDYLKDFRFTGDVYSVKEGEIVFPNEPVLRVKGNIIEAQLVETLLLNFLNFESLVATKAARIKYVAGNRVITDFGLRRAHALAGIHASRAAVIGGIDSTSNVWSARAYGIAASGTMAHSFIQSYDDELTAFRQFAQAHPDNCILLVDTYSTLDSGIPHAITVGKELAEQGHELKAIRLDSGDLAYMARKSRHLLDQAGLKEVKIVASNQLDEHLIKSLLDQKAPIDIFGVGTSLVTGQPSGAHDGVYKLSMSNNEPRLKLSENEAKISLPGIKAIFRCINGNGFFAADAVALKGEKHVQLMHHPYVDKSMNTDKYIQEPLHVQMMEKGKIISAQPSAREAAKYVQQRLKQLPDEYKRFVNPHIYKIGLSESLYNMRKKLIQELKSVKQ